MDFRGPRFADHARDLKGNNDLLVLTQPDVIREIGRAYLAAGADIIETNSFNSTAISQADYGLESLVPELNETAARLAREVCDEASTAGRPRLVAGVLGPTNRTASLSPDVNDPGFRNVDFDTLSSAYSDATRALIRGGADLIMIETVFDTLNAKAAVLCRRRRIRRTGRTASGLDFGHYHGSIRTYADGPDRRGPSGIRSVMHRHLLLVSTAHWDPKELRPLCRGSRPEIADTLTSAHPNAGPSQCVWRV